MQNKWLSALLVIACVALLSGIGFASACPSGGYMSTYLTPGFSCGIDDKTFSHFIYTSTSSPPGFEIMAGSVGVTPITTPFNPGFQFNAPWHAYLVGILSSNSKSTSTQVAT